MGSYADPKMIVDKRFEKVRGELDKLYKNVEGNLQLIGKRKQARKAAQAKKYGSFGDVYNKSVKESRASSRKFARTRPDMAKDAKKQFSNQIASRFDEGYDNKIGRDTSELQSLTNLVCRLLLGKKNKAYVGNCLFE